MSDLLNVTSSPHVRDKMDTQKIMALVVISLLPASIFGICNFGLHALVLILVTIASCVASEWIYEKIVHNLHSQYRRKCIETRNPQNQIFHSVYKSILRTEMKRLNLIVMERTRQEKQI